MAKKDTSVSLFQMLEDQLMTLYTYLPPGSTMRIRRGETLPDRTSGGALFANISGFTALNEGLRDSLGPHCRWVAHDFKIKKPSFLSWAFFGWGSGIRTPISTSRAWRAAVAPIPKILRADPESAVLPLDEPPPGCRTSGPAGGIVTCDAGAIK
jgi:hypothetical protein